MHTTESHDTRWLQDTLVVEDLEAELRARSRLGAAAYLATYALLLSITPLRSDHPGLSDGYGLLLLVTSLGRLWAASPRPPRARMAVLRLLILAQAAIWGVLAATVLTHYGLDWTAVLTLVMTAALASAAPTTAASDQRLIVGGSALLLGPSLLAVLASHGSLPGALALVLAVHLAFLFVLGRRQSLWFRELVSSRVLLRQQAASLEAAQRSHEAFLSVMSHELRTPLTALQGAIGLLQGQAAAGMSETGSRLLQLASRNTGRLASLISDLLEYQRLLFSRRPPPDEEATLQEIIERAVASVSEAAARRRMRLDVSADAGRVSGDVHLVERAVAHLLENAVKFSEEDRRVGVSGRQEGDHVVFQITDEGPGIETQVAERMFEPFRQGDSSDARGHGGTGLGLALCGAVARHHQGRLWVDSSPGKGSSFSLSIPRGSRT